MCKLFFSSPKLIWIIFEDTIANAEVSAGLNNSKIKHYKVKELNKWKFVYNPTPKLLLSFVALYTCGKRNNFLLTGWSFVQDYTSRKQQRKQQETKKYLSLRPTRCEWSMWCRVVSFLEEAVKFFFLVNLVPVFRQWPSLNLFFLLLKGTFICCSRVSSMC